MKFVLTVDVGNAAMSKVSDLVALLHDAAKKIQQRGTEGSIQDRNGNTVCRYQMESKLSDVVDKLIG